MEEGLLYVVIAMNKGVVGLTSVWNVGTRDKSYAPQATYLYIADEKCGDKVASYEPFPPAESPNKQ
ncbi:hypothetical protein CFP56_015171 [Quercus suber]|uniref:Uncharacterized protein n=1 Tax=Quercus suber TaxID=58331 RepID=A0AAW0KR04_QUESU